MEELIVFLLQFILEVTVQLIGYLPIDLLCKNSGNSKVSNQGRFYILFIIGVGFGLMANYFHPKVFIHLSELRIVNVIAGPFINGYVSYKLSVWRNETKDKGGEPKDHFWYAFVFSLGFVLIRFMYGER